MNLSQLSLSFNFCLVVFCVTSMLASIFSEILSKNLLLGMISKLYSKFLIWSRFFWGLLAKYCNNKKKFICDIGTVQTYLAKMRKEANFGNTTIEILTKREERREK